jgi:hypothetical protein
MSAAVFIARSTLTRRRSRGSDWRPRRRPAAGRHRRSWRGLVQGLNLQDCDKIINYDLHWNPVRLIQRFGRIDRIGTTHEEIHGYNFLPETGIEENLGLKEKLQQRIREIQETIGEDGKILDPSEQVNHEALYAIYGADEGDGGQQSLALFDEGGDEDDDLVDLGETIEMFRQMREEDPHEFHRIASLRDGIRAARKRRAGSGAEGSGEGEAYVFCQAGEHQRFYAVDATEEAREVSTQGFLGALRCEPSEKGLKSFPAGHNAAVAAAKRSFVEHLEKVRAQQASQSELPRGQRYALKELQKLYGQLGSEERRERIERLEEVFRFETNMAARRELNGIHRAKLTGDEMVVALEKLYTKYRLGETRGDSRESRRRAEVDLIPRIVVSESLEYG